MTERVGSWWRNGVPLSVKLVCLVLLANGVPAFFILISAPGSTDDLFVWTIQPEASARLLGVMYGNALLLVGLGLAQPDWPRMRVTMVVIAWFSVAATIVTLFNLDPFLEHPWYHLAYWLSMYAILFVAAPAVFVHLERRYGGRLPVTVALSPAARVAGTAAAVILAASGVALFVSTSFVSDVWPWELTPLVGRILAVWLTALAAAYAWALWDGDWLRGRPIFVQGIVTGIALGLIPLVHSDEVKSSAGGELAVYLALAALLVICGLLSMRQATGAAQAGRLGARR